jgi:hypothetical protein
MKTKYSTLSAAEAKSRDRILSSACAIRGRWWAVALGGFVFTSLFALPAPPVEAECEQWNVGHGWRFKQGTTNVDLDLHQNGTVVTGTATHMTYTPDGSHGKSRVDGDVDGTVEGDHFAVHIQWDNNTTGVYDGTIRPSGRIEGTGYNQATPRIKVRWHSETSMVCADTAAQPINPAPPPIKSSGKMPAEPTPKPIKSSGKFRPSSPPTQSSAAAPTIKANPVAVTIPEGQSHGRTTLTWDAGPDHPDAEVWMKDMQGEERLVVQQGKGTRSVTVERGKNYQVILTDAGQQLARAAVLTKQ